MPVCTFVVEYDLEENRDFARVTVVPSGTLDIEFSAIVQSAFPSVRVKNGSKDPLDMIASPTPTENFDIYDAHDQTRVQIRAFLDLLCRSVAIKDQLDESHALAPHSLPPDRKEEKDWPRTKVGSLVNEAKDYDRERAYKDGNAVRLIEQRLIDFINLHPRYRLADGIVPTPSSNPSRISTLVTTLAKRLANSTRKSLIVPDRYKSVAAMKEFDESKVGSSAESAQHDSIRMHQDLKQKNLILFDDLYKTGGTIHEVARACRAAGAESVLGLTVTKTSKFARGWELSKWSLG